MTANTRIDVQLRHTSKQLGSISDSPRLDAELLLCHCLDKPRSYLYTWPEGALTPRQLHQFQQLVQQRLAGQPIAYLLGYREFWGLRLAVTPDTLIPRPETELLVELALNYLADKPAVHILDLGTGSGAIALALAHERPDAYITATDLSASALQVARNNARRLGLQNIRFAQSDWFTAIPDTSGFTLIISNPPYIAGGDSHLQQGDVKFEPKMALVSGDDGLDSIRTLIKTAPQYLQSNGMLMFEHGYQQGQQTVGLLQKAGYQQITSHQDLAGHDRVTLGIFP